jgi:hypothetical protein
MRNFRKATKEVFVPKVKPDNGAHATSNRAYVCYSGEETVSHSPSEGEIRASALQALDDMEESFDTDFPNLSPRKFMPGAMGVQVTQATGTEQCYKIYYHSSMRQHKAPLFNGSQVALTEKFQQLVLQDDGHIANHRREYRCTEPGLLTNSGNEFPESALGSRVYIVDKNGQFLPPCGGDLGADTGQIGCSHFIATAGVVAVPNGPASTTSGNTTGYFWYRKEQVRPKITCRISGRKASRMISSITKEINSALSAAHSSGAAVNLDQKQLSGVKTLVGKLIKEISFELDRKICSRMTNRLSFPDAYEKASNEAHKAVDRMAAPIAHEVAPSLDNETVSAIVSKVLDAIVVEVANRISSKPPLRSMTGISVNEIPHPVDSMTVQELRSALQSRTSSRFAEGIDKSVQEETERNGPSAFQKWLDEQKGSGP